MDDYKQNYANIALTVVIFLASFFFKTQILHMFLWIWQRFCVKKNISEDFQQDIVEIKKVIEQIVREWIGMSKFISQIQDDQNHFASHLLNLFETKHKILEQNLTATMDEVFKRNDLRNAEMRRTIERMREEIQSFQTFLGTPLPKSSSELHETPIDENTSSPTDREIRKETRLDEMAYSLKQNGNEVGYETSELIVTVQNCLTHLLNDAKLHLSVDREEENRKLEIALQKLTEQGEDIKKMILRTFSIAAEQAEKDYDQFGQIGEGASKYLAVVNDNTNKLLNEKLHETGDVLKDALTFANRQTLDIDAVIKILENMDGQFVELFEKLTQIYRINIEHSGGIALSLERTSDNWVQTVSKIEKMVNQICDDAKHVKQIHKEMKDLSYAPQKEDTDNGEKEERNETVQYDSAGVTIKDHQILSQKEQNRIFVYSFWERMRSVSCNVVNGCHSACKLVGGLDEKLRSLNESVEKLDGFIRGLNLEFLAERTAFLNSNHDISEIARDIVQTSEGVIGDGKSQVLHNTSNKMRNESFVHKIANRIAIDIAVKWMRIALRKVREKNNCQDDENSMQSKPNNSFTTAKESQPIETAYEEHISRDSLEPHVDKSQTKQNKF